MNALLWTEGRGVCYIRQLNHQEGGGFWWNLLYSNGCKQVGGETGPAPDYRVNQRPTPLVPVPQPPSTTLVGAVPTDRVYVRAPLGDLGSWKFAEIV